MDLKYNKVTAQMIFLTSVHLTACVISQDTYLPNQENQTEKKDFKTDTATIEQVTTIDERIENGFKNFIKSP